MMTERERGILRELAGEVARIARLPVMEERRRLWRAHNSLVPERPMLLVFPEGSWGELLPRDVLECENEEARGIEWELRRRLYKYRHIHDDSVVEGEWIVHKVVHNSGWGLQPKHVPSTRDRGAWGFDPVITEPGDLDQLRMPDIEVDKEATEQKVARARHLFGDLLTVRLRGVSRISFHLMNFYCQLRGLDQVMLDMYDHPGMLHRAMSFLTRGHKRLVEQYIDHNLLSLNNDGTYHSSGGVGYTRELPRAGWDPDYIRPCDVWASAEAQEMAQVSPEMHEEFILSYERELLEPFGLNGYGCCEDLTHKLDHVFEIPNLRRISISPWADVEACAQKLGDRYIFSWKPNPAHLVGGFDENRLTTYIQKTLEATAGCVLEMVLKDTHTCQDQPERFTRWTEIARACIEEAC